MRPAPGEWDDLRLAAKAANRGKAAEKLWPAFEKRLNELGYGPLAIAHAFSSLTGPATVAEALAELAEKARFERSTTVPLDFETVEDEPALPVGYSLTITGVERDDHGIHIRYTIHPPLPRQAGPRCEARDDCGQEYTNTGGAFFGLAGPVDCTTSVGGLTMPLPQEHASLLRVRFSWSQDSTSLWQRPAHELRIAL
jgi:hypothetical protein